MICQFRPGEIKSKMSFARVTFTGISKPLMVLVQR